MYDTCMTHIWHVLQGNSVNKQNEGYISILDHFELPVFKLKTVKDFGCVDWNRTSEHVAVETVVPGSAVLHIAINLKISQFSGSFGVVQLQLAFPKMSDTG